MSDIPWWVWLIVVAVVVVIIIALVVRKKPTVADNIHDAPAWPHVPAGTAEDVSTSQAATTNSAGQAMTSGATAATAAGVTGATSGARRMAEDDIDDEAAADGAADPRHSTTPDEQPDEASDDDLAREREALEAEQPRRQATDPDRVAEEQRGHASDEESPPHTEDPDETIGAADADESFEQASAPDDDARPTRASQDLAAADPEAGEPSPAARETDNVDATIGAEGSAHYTPSTHGRDAVETQRRLTEDLGLNPDDDSHAGHAHGAQSQGFRDASTGPDPGHKPYNFAQDTEADTGVPLADATEQLQRAEMREQSRDHGYGELVDSGEQRPDLTVDPGSTPPVEDAGPGAQELTTSVEDPAPTADPDHQDSRVTEPESSVAPSEEAPEDASEADAPTGSDTEQDYDVPRDEYGRRLDPYGNPVDD